MNDTLPTITPADIKSSTDFSGLAALRNQAKSQSPASVEGGRAAVRVALSRHDDEEHARGESWQRSRSTARTRSSIRRCGTSRSRCRCRKGKGFGIADMMLRQLCSRQASRNRQPRTQHRRPPIPTSFVRNRAAACRTRRCEARHTSNRARRASRAGNRVGHQDSEAGRRRLEQ